MVPITLQALLLALTLTLFALTAYLDSISRIVERFMIFVKLAISLLL